MLADVFVLAFSKQNKDRVGNGCKGKKIRKREATWQHKLSFDNTNDTYVSFHKDLENNHQIQ